MYRKLSVLILVAMALVACNRSSSATNELLPGLTEPPDGAPSEIELTATTAPEMLFEGSWFADDIVDGSSLSLDIFLPPEGGILFAYSDAGASGCDGQFFRSEGTAELAGPNTIVLTGTGTCENSSQEISFTLEMTYDPSENVLRESSGQTWIRS